MNTHITYVKQICYPSKGPIFRLVSDYDKFSDGLNLTICIFYWMSSLTLDSLLDLAVKPILGIGVSGFNEPVLCVLFSNAYPIMMTSVSLIGFCFNRHKTFI